MKISIASLIYKSTYYSDQVYESLVEYTPQLQRDDCEFFFVANDASDRVLEHLKKKQYPHYIHTNEKKTDKELFAMGIGWPNYLHGVYRAWNKAIEMSKGEVVVLINSDMMFYTNWLDNLLKHVDKKKFVCSQLVERFNEKMGGIFPGCVRQEFGSSPRNFQKDNFKNFARIYTKKNANGVKLGGAFMPCAIKKEYLLKVGGYPDGNLAGSSFEDIKEYGDRCLVRKLNEIGIQHITALDSIVYHFKEGEMEEDE
ncbi:MAG: hypothetical protein BV459_05675 [Thermoplasmata archaeon M11B2D]|nr:MAG: hypothetical protein BV459_05675 [Thermoplasmata archaeon M11B2D]